MKKSSKLTLKMSFITFLEMIIYINLPLWIVFRWKRIHNTGPLLNVICASIAICHFVSVIENWSNHINLFAITGISEGMLILQYPIKLSEIFHIFVNSHWKYRARDINNNVIYNVSDRAMLWTSKMFFCFLFWNNKVLER